MINNRWKQKNTSELLRNGISIALKAAIAIALITSLAVTSTSAAGFNRQHRVKRQLPTSPTTTTTTTISPPKTSAIRWKPQVFVVLRNEKLNVSLFTVTSSLNTNVNLNFKFSNSSSVASSLFSITPNAGIVSKKTEFPSSVFKVDFEVEASNSGVVETSYPVTVQIVSRGPDDRIFTNRPYPMWTVIDIWTRPYTVIQTLQSVDVAQYGATDVTYVMEQATSDGGSSFAVDALSGDVYVTGRHQFINNSLYSLLISARSSAAKVAASASSMPSLASTFAQALNVQVGIRNPQFFESPYNITFLESSTPDSVIGKIEAKSFQNLPLTISISPSLTDHPIFSFNPATNEVRLKKSLSYLTDVRGYFFTATASEQYTNFGAITQVAFTLLPVNHAPEFAVAHYARYDVLESTAVGTELLKMSVRDYDPGALGFLTFNCSVDTFRAEMAPDGMVSLKINKPLDFESIIGQRYTLQVVAVDGGVPALTGSTEVQIWVTNTNNKAPVFEPANQQVTIQEGAATGLVVYYVQAYDPDGDDLTFNLIGGKIVVFDGLMCIQSQVSLPTSYFNLDPSSGKITLSNDIVPGNNDIASFILTISITDTGSCCQTPGQTHTVTGTVVVNVFRVNTQPTFKECKIYQPTVVEDASADLNTSILNMTATDNDSGPNGELEYRIFGEEKNFFLVRESKTLPKTAELYLQQSISRSSTNLYKFNDTFKLPVVVKVQDKGSPRLSTNCFLFVTIQTINKKAPVFDYQEQNAYYYTPLSQPGDNILRVFAFDEDFGLNGEIYYYFDSTYTGLNSNLCGNSVFVDRNSGWITWSGGDLSPKIITCSVIASDKGRPPLTSQPTFITIELFASNDFIPPKWDKLNGVEIDNAFFEVPENTAANQPFLSLKATLYNDTTIDYFIPTESISVLNGDHSFDIRKNSTWMSIIVATPLKESNQMPFYYLRCRAFIMSKRDATQKIVTIARLKVNIKDVNNQAPRFLGMDSNGGYPASVTQYSKNGDFVAFVTAIDSDKDWPNNKITYSLMNTADSSLFSIDSLTGEIKVNSFQTGGQPIFNPDIKKVYTLTVIATDGAPSTINGPLPNNATAQVQIVVNGGKADSPYFSQNFSTSLSESVTRNSTVLLATVAPSTTPLNKVYTPQYNIQGGNVGRKFAVDNNTGRIYTVGELDAMKITYVSVTLLSDQNRRPPTFSAAEYLYSKNDVIEKDSQSVNKVIAQIQATSPSNNQPITYSSSQPDNFVVSSSGQVSIVRPLSRDPPNGFSPQQVNVIADNGLTRGYSVVTLPLIDINDNTPLFDLCCVAGRVNEKMPSNTSVMTLKANDADSGRNAEVDFSLVDPSDYFSVQPDGLIMTRVSLTMDKQKHTLKVRVTDRGAPSPETFVDIYVNEVSDFVPSFPLQSYQDTIPEKLPVGSLATSVSVTDRDMLDTVSYTLMDKPGSQDAAFFYVDSLQVFDGLYSENNAKRYSSASIKISKIIDFDSNRKSTYSFILSAQDSAQRSTTTQVTIAVRDINDHAPAFLPQSKNVSISELDPVGKSVATFAATDADSGDNAKYSIDYENTDPKFNFKIDSLTGAVTIRSRLDYEWRSSMKVNILAVDLGTPAQTGTATMFVTVTNEVDSPPIIKFNSSPYSNSNNIQDAPIVVRSNLQRSQPVSCLNAIDPDSNNINGLNFDLVCTNPNQRCSDFTIGNDGCLRANRDGYSRSNLGFDSYNIPVKVTKSGTQSTTQDVKLLIEGTDSVQPTNGAKHADVMNFVGENGAFSSIPLGNVFISDPDAWDINKDTFTIQNPNTYFRLLG
ncbi:hypothetical protein HELRODRAFT_170509 [Helobdella robusta]|uniref:Cadherin domain-containing protein n=1 Tax=Helobdella robusta TaxID=6412 RepID=T1F353_HELRO|nr:hypothetical protein HELRODRAFT_170509 [Helobdella robusta]ESO07199.1 hypothetical protein HELRODRAFT_170509 [Helobdella robusta]